MYNQQILREEFNGDWGLGIGDSGDWAQSPIPNPPIPQSPIPNFNYFLYFVIILKNLNDL